MYMCTRNRAYIGVDLLVVFILDRDVIIPFFSTG